MEKDGFFNNEGNGMGTGTGMGMGMGMGIPQSWNSIFAMEMENQVTGQIPNCFLNQNWDNSVDQSDPFESALSSIVSSPVNSHAGIPIPAGENVVLKELIGRLGIICNSGEITPRSCVRADSSANTPLNSPPKLNLSIMDCQQIHGNLSIPRNNQLPPPPAVTFPADPGFVERAAKFSCFGKKEPEFPIPIPASDSVEESKSSLSEQFPNGETGIKGQNTYSNGRKRKAVLNTLSVKDSKTVGEPEKQVSDSKRSKLDEDGNQNQNQKQSKENAKVAEAPKDYIHVRARRGEATDSHSLAERVRREKISERMKFLQDLVPGCNKVTGKAVMLDEIINYVQSLQRQVEFLSMKLATINPRTDMNMDAVLSKDTRASMLNTMNHLDALAQPFYVMVHDGPENPSMMQRGLNLKSSHMQGFGEPTAFWENDLQSVVQTGFNQNHGPSFHGSAGTSQMKVEL